MGRLGGGQVDLHGANEIRAETRRERGSQLRECLQEECYSIGNNQNKCPEAEYWRNVKKTNVTRVSGKQVREVMGAQRQDLGVRHEDLTFSKRHGV